MTNTSVDIPVKGSVIRYSTTSAGAASAPARAKDVPAVRTRAS